MFLMGEEERIEYAPTESYISLKFKAGEREEFSGYVRYRTSFFGILGWNLRIIPKVAFYQMERTI